MDLTELQDDELSAVFRSLSMQDPDGSRMATAFRLTFDQLYDGQRTGRFRWDQLFKTEKTHYGTLLEINLQRDFLFEDGAILDYRIAGVEVDCKYSASSHWMLPPESIDQIVLVCSADDEKSAWSVGLVRATEENRNVGLNRDRKGSLNQLGRSRIRWLRSNSRMQPNVLLQLTEFELDRIFLPSTGQARLNELFRVATNRRISRNIVATVAQQDDFMKRVRSNGGARSALRPEGLVILSGDYVRHRSVAHALGCVVPLPGEVISARLGPVDVAMAQSVEIDGTFWRHLAPNEQVVSDAPVISHR